MSDSPVENIAWRVSWRRDRKGAWMDWATSADETQARNDVSHIRRQYPHYLVKLEKVTTTIEHVDA